MRGAELSTDHRMVVSKMKLSIRPPIKKRAGQAKICVSKLQENANRDRYQQGLEDALRQSNYYDLFFEVGPDEAWSKFSQLLADTANEKLGRETRKIRD